MPLRPSCRSSSLYVHCPASNISIARNACLDNSTGDFLAFIDDDETASSEWLAELIEDGRGDRRRRGARPGARRLFRRSAGLDAARRFPFDAAGLGRRRDPHRLHLQRACCAALRRTLPGRRFNLALGQTGGEDTEYFTADARGRRPHRLCAARRWSIEPVPASARTLLLAGQAPVPASARPMAGCSAASAPAAGLLPAGRPCRRPRRSIASRRPRRWPPFRQAPQPLSCCAASCIPASSAGCSASAKSACMATVSRSGGTAMQPDVSFVIAAFNAEATIARAIQSALDQRDVSGRGDRRRRLFERPHRRDRALLSRRRACGSSRSNRTVARAAPAMPASTAARGRWIAVLDSDDTVYPDRLARMIRRGRRSRAPRSSSTISTSCRKTTSRRETMFSAALLARASPRSTLADFIAANLMFETTFSFGYMKPIFERQFLERHALALRRDAAHRRGLHPARFGPGEGRALRRRAERGYSYHVRDGLDLAGARTAPCRGDAGGRRGLPARPCSSMRRARAAQARRTRSLEEAASFLTLVQHLKDSGAAEGGRRGAARPGGAAASRACRSRRRLRRRRAAPSARGHSIRSA